MLKNSMLYPRCSATRRVVSLDGLWDFQFDPQSAGRSEGWPERGLPSPIQMPVPASFADFFTDKESREYCGDFWYQSDFFVPGEWESREIAIRFGSATHRATVFVNGIETVSHEGGFLPFCAKITDAVHFNAVNRVSVLVNNELRVTGLPCGETITLPDGRKMAKPYFDFYNYSGLQRPVWLTAAPKESVFDFSLRYELSGPDADVHYQAITTGEHPVTVSLYDAAGSPVTQCEGKQGVLHVKDARLWQVRTARQNGGAYLYRIAVRIMDGGQIVDEYEQDIGIRTVEVRGKDVLINGAPVYLKGFGKHEDSDIIGRGFSAAVMKRDFELMKWIGANSFRTSHYPYSEEIYQMADREGFLVIDETPAVGMFKSLMNFMEASTGKHSAFFSMPTTPQLLENHLTAVEEMITRDKNYACVAVWSLLNEPETTDPAAVPYFEKVFAAAHALDPQKRPRTFALIMNSTPGACHCYPLCDIVCLNRYYGWYVSGGNEIGVAEQAFRKEMDAWAGLNLEKPFFFTEYGADTNPAEHKLPSVMWSQEYQEEYLQMCHRVFDSYDFIRGEQVWNFADFQTTEGIMRMNGNKKGIFTRQRQPKAAAYLLKKRWESLPPDFKGKG